MLTAFTFIQVLKIQPQTFKSSYIKLIALLWGLVYSPVYVIIAITRVSGSATLGASIAFGVLYVITALAYILIRNVRKDCKCLKVVWLVDIAYFIGGILYYVGRNFQLPIAQSILLGMVVVLYRFIPFFISKYYQSNLAKEHQTTEAKLQLVPEWILAAESLTLLVDFDALYTVTINSFFSSDIPCHSWDAKIIGSWLLWAVFVLIYTIILYYTMNIQYHRNWNINKSCIISNHTAIILSAVFGIYLLGNSYTVVLIDCSGPNTVIAFIVLIAVNVLVLIVVITVIVLLMVYRCMSKTRQEKLLPHALYQHLHPEPDEMELPLETVSTEIIISD